MPPLSRLALRVVAIPIVLAFAAEGGAGPAVAQPLDEADATVQALREEADHAAQEYFDALARATELDTTIEHLERRLPDLVRRRQRLLERSERRAVDAYIRSGAQLAVLIASSDVLTVTRRRQLLAALNARDNALFTELSETTRRVQTQRRRLRNARTQHEQTLADLDQRGRDIDATLQAALDRRNQLAAEAQAAAAAQAAQAAPAAPPPEPAPAPVGAPSASPESTEIPTTPPPGYEPTPGTHRHHDHPFLACTRARESSGNYGAVNPAGPYLGAYQFLQSTWNSGANHAGRLELVGVPPNTASEYDQDDVAWTIYQWRGKAPWGDDC